MKSKPSKKAAPKKKPQPSLTKAKAAKDSSDREARINRGELETKNLAECLKVDFALLHASLFPSADKSTSAAIEELKQLGILKRMEQMAALLLAREGAAVEGVLAKHPSDTVRSWGAFVVGQLPGLTLARRLERIRPYADDSHFGVREWAWMAVRSHIAGNLEESIAILAAWTKHPSHRVRRFASEATRPRGVWAAHIQALKDQPELGLPILHPLRADEERYVQDSVANWLNDAAKSQPGWVKKTCKEWEKGGSKATAYIVKRALRSLK